MRKVRIMEKKDIEKTKDIKVIQKSEEVLESSYKSLQRQYQTKEDELAKSEREKEEFRKRLAVYDHVYQPSHGHNTLGLRGKAVRMEDVKEGH